MDDDFETSTIKGVRFRGIDAAVIGIGFVRNVASAVEEALDSLEQFTMAHANWLFDRERFHEDAAVELESLMRGEGDES